MTIHEMLASDREEAFERRQLAEGRIFQIADEQSVREPYREYFRKTAELILKCADAADRALAGELKMASLEELKTLNRSLYEDILPENYETSWGNPAYAVREAGGIGRYLAFLYAEIRCMVPYACEGRTLDIAILEELFLEVYNLFETPAAEAGPEELEKGIRDILYYHMFDYADRILPERNRETLDPEADYGRKIVMESDLTDLSYLYRYGEYISETEIRTAEYLNRLPEETVRGMADTFTRGFIGGFEASHRSYRSKSIVQLRYAIGFERMMRYAIEDFEALGLKCVVPRMAHGSMNQERSRETGYYGTPANRQYDYDHRYDMAAWFDRGMKERKLEVLRTAYRDAADLARAYAGPAVLEVFGAPAFAPENKPEAWALSEKQENLRNQYTAEAMPIVQEYMPGSETSFTIIAFPLPDIGEHYEDIFRETIRVNTLDNDTYRRIQQNIIDVLDTADYARVLGRGGNETDLRIALYPLRVPSKQSRFENCVADVNIPVGEVFTSPVLQGTNGLLHVQNVFIDGYHFRNLRVEFRDGRAVSGTCENFTDREQNRNLVRQVIFKDHSDLPMGEFAIGTNTTAYAMGQRYGIEGELPILIAEKTGPHFAVGDTCYSWMEDVPVINPDGREMIARDNEVSRLRGEDPGKAYFGCHTDITIPYSELGSVTAVRADGTEIPILAGGRFVLQGTEELNQPLDELKKEKA